MALQSSGAISLADIAGEFGGSAPHSLSEYYGVASGIPASGQISFSQFYGKANIFALDINTSNGGVYVQNMNLSSYATANGWDGSAPIDLDVNNVVYSTSSSSPALLVNVANTTIKNNSWILGRGGDGGDSSLSGSGGAPGDGTAAIQITVTGVTVTNYSGKWISGGGGGGVGGYFAGGGGGGGGGQGGDGSRNGSLNGRVGASGGSIGNNGGAPVEGKDSGDRYGANCGGAGGAGTAWFDGGGDGGGGGGRVYPNNAKSCLGPYAYQGHHGGSGGGPGLPGGTTTGPWSPTSGVYSPNFGPRGGSYAGGGGGGYGANGEGNPSSAGAAITSSQPYTLSNSGTINGST